MSIRVECSQCKKVLWAEEKDAGKRTKCPGCSAVLEIPRSTSSTEQTAALAPIPASTPSEPDDRSMCAVQGCKSPVNREGHQFCYNHWKASRGGGVRQCRKCGKWFEMAGPTCPACDKDPETTAPGQEQKPSTQLSSTKLGEHFGITSRKMNLILAELGWIEKYVKGWIPTEQGHKHGGLRKEMRENGVPYVVWPTSIVENKVLLDSIRESQGETRSSGETSEPAADDDRDSNGTEAFRNRFPAQFRTTDGHRVRSRAEVLIDNWLYMQKIVHAYERRVPIEEELLCDFYLPDGNVYIEYWGMERDRRYAERMQKKRELYGRHGLNLVELNDESILNLDDVLPRMLLKFGIDCT